MCFCPCRNAQCQHVFAAVDSQRASSSTSFLFNAGKDGKSKVSRLLVTGNFAALMPLGGPLFTVSFQLQSCCGSSSNPSSRGALPRQFVVLAQEGWHRNAFKCASSRSASPLLLCQQCQIAAAEVCSSWAAGRCGYFVKSKRGGRCSMRHSTKCLTASKPIAPNSQAWRTAAATCSNRKSSSNRNTCTYSRLPGFPNRASSKRLKHVNSGSSQPANGAA